MTSSLHLIIVVELFSQRDVSLNEETSVNRNLITSSKNLFVNFRWTFTFCVEKSHAGKHLAFGGTLDRRYHFKHVSLKTKQVLRMTNEHGSQVKDQGLRQCCHNKHKNFPFGLHVMYLYFPDTHLTMYWISARDKDLVLITVKWGHISLVLITVKWGHISCDLPFCPIL